MNFNAAFVDPYRYSDSLRQSLVWSSARHIILDHMIKVSVHTRCQDWICLSVGLIFFYFYGKLDELLR